MAHPFPPRRPAVLLTLTTPLRLTADTGIDACTHAIEAYVAKHANPFSDSMAIAAMRSIWPNLRRVCEAPGDRAAREAMMVGSLQAGIAFSNASVALVHGMSRPIGRSEEHTSELQSLMRISYAVFCLKKKKQRRQPIKTHT